MRVEPYFGGTGRMPGLLPLFVGMEMVLQESLLPPRYVRGAPCKVVGIEPHLLEPPLEGRASIASDGVAVLWYMPKCVYVKIEGSNELFLQAADKFLQTSAARSRPVDLSAEIDHWKIVYWLAKEMHIEDEMREGTIGERMRQSQASRKLQPQAFPQLLSGCLRPQATPYAFQHSATGHVSQPSATRRGSCLWV